MFKDNRPFSNYRRSILRAYFPHNFGRLPPLLEEAQEELKELRGSGEPEDVDGYLTALKRVSFLTDLVELFEVKK